MTEAGRAGSRRNHAGPLSTLDAGCAGAHVRETGAVVAAYAAVLRIVEGSTIGAVGPGVGTVDTRVRAADPHGAQITWFIAEDGVAARDGDEQRAAQEATCESVRDSHGQEATAPTAIRTPTSRNASTSWRTRS